MKASWAIVRNQQRTARFLDLSCDVESRVGRKHAARSTLGADTDCSPSGKVLGGHPSPRRASDAQKAAPCGDEVLVTIAMCKQKFKYHNVHVRLNRRRASSP